MNIKKGILSINTLNLPFVDKINKLVTDGKEIKFNFENLKLNFDKMCINKSMEIFYE